MHFSTSKSGMTCTLRCGDLSLSALIPSPKPFFPQGHICHWSIQWSLEPEWRYWSPGFPWPALRECHSVTLLNGFHAPEEALDYYRYQGHWCHCHCSLYPCHSTLGVTLLFTNVFDITRIPLFFSFSLSKSHPVLLSYGPLSETI